MGKLRKLATGYQWEKIPNDVRVAMLEEDARIEALEASVAAADALAEAVGKLSLSKYGPAPASVRAALAAYQATKDQSDG